MRILGDGSMIMDGRVISSRDDFSSVKLEIPAGHSISKRRFC